MAKSMRSTIASCCEVSVSYYDAMRKCIVWCEKHYDAAVGQNTCGRWLLEAEAPPQNVTKVRVIAHFANPGDLDVVSQLAALAATGVWPIVNCYY